MTDRTFEALLSARLREYADGGVRPIDHYATAEGSIASGRGLRFGWRWSLGRSRRPLTLVLVGLLVVALLASAAVVGSQLLGPVQVRGGFAGELTSASDLAAPVWQPERVLLEDGRVLLVGGNSGLTTTSQIYDPKTGASTRTGPMVSADAFVPSSAVRLHDGRVLVIGDTRPFDGPAFAVAQVFDPRTGQFAPVGPMVTPRASAELAVLPDGSVLMTGGTDPMKSTRRWRRPRSSTPSPGHSARRARCARRGRSTPWRRFCAVASSWSAAKRQRAAARLAS